MDAPTWTPIWLVCRACRHAWDDWQPNGAPPATWIAHIGTYRCPQCRAGSDDILIRTKPLTTPE